VTDHVIVADRLPPRPPLERALLRLALLLATLAVVGLFLWRVTSGGSVGELIGIAFSLAVVLFALRTIWLMTRR